MLSPHSRGAEASFQDTERYVANVTDETYAPVWPLNEAKYGECRLKRDHFRWNFVRRII